VVFVAEGIVIPLPGFEIRDWRLGDAAALARHANDPRIARNLRDRFPHPYTVADADAFLATAVAMQPRTFFAIAVDGQAVGGIGYTLHDDVERASVEIGYWLGTAFWGRGMMTAAVAALTQYVFDQHADVQRIYAVPFSGSVASLRVLDKAGYQVEGRMRDSAIKHGQVSDQLLYAAYRSTQHSAPARDAACVFCAIVHGELTPQAVAYRDADAAVFPARHQRPANRGHMLVVPVSHVSAIYDIGRPLGGALLDAVARISRALKRAWGADGVCIRQNNEPHGGQDVFHLHFHVIPRFAGDGFDIGEDRFPFGAVEVPIAERMAQAARLREALNGER
jgi:RimJ/RimL family protein N-acetyltransferase/diadenosine tetraphosphate (Ap4A) HIT family hydrolase